MYLNTNTKLSLDQQMRIKIKIDAAKFELSYGGHKLTEDRPGQ